MIWLIITIDLRVYSYYGISYFYIADSSVLFWAWRKIRDEALKTRFDG